MYAIDRSRMCSSILRKDKYAGQVFGSGFSWSEAADAVADIYNGVNLMFYEVVATLIIV